MLFRSGRARIARHSTARIPSIPHASNDRGAIGHDNYRESFSGLELRWRDVTGGR